MTFGNIVARRRKHFETRLEQGRQFFEAEDSDARQRGGEPDCQRNSFEAPNDLSCDGQVVGGEHDAELTHGLSKHA